MISRDEESFYSFQFLKDTQYDGQGNNKYLPQLFGVYYQRSIQEETTIGLISMEPENFNYITFEIFPILGEISFSIFECHEYPLCQTYNNRNSSKIQGYKSYYLTYSKDEWDKNITPISKNQNMIFITCIKGADYDVLKKVCHIFSNIKTDRSKYYL